MPPPRGVALFHLLNLFVSPALGKLYVTTPVDGTTWTAGQNQTLSWKDDGSEPTLAKFKDASVGIFVGSSTVQTLVQEIVASVDVATTESIVFTPDPSVGANGDYYFIRFQSLALKDANNSAFPAEAFSATFTMNGMTGSFNESERAEIGSIAAAATAPASTAQSAGAMAATAGFRIPTSSHEPDAMPTSTADAAANGAAHRVGGVSVGVASAFATLLLAAWVM